METVSMEKQQDMLKVVKTTFEQYKNLSQVWRDRNVQIYSAYSTFTQPKKADWQTTFKVNKAHEVVNKILPRIMAKNPKWIVSVRNDSLMMSGTTPEDMITKMKDLEEMAVGIQDYLTHIFDRYNLREPLRLWAKNMLIYGNSFAKIQFKYKTIVGDEDTQYPENDEEGNQMMDEEGKPMYKKGKKQKEKVVGEYPCIEAKSWTDIYIDPRYVMLEDAPAIIDITSGVKLQDLKRKKKEYMNLDLIEKLPQMSDFATDPDGYKQRLFSLSGITQDTRTVAIDQDRLTLKTYYGWYKYEEEDEKLCEIVTVDDLFTIKYEEISYIPIEEIKCFEDTEVFYAVGFVEPILGMQDEMNFKKNSASEYINQALNRSWIWSPNSGINPKDLQSKPGNIIPTSKDAQTAMQNVQELPFRPLTMDYFQEQNDLERQIQSATFTVDTSNQQNQQALTNTATGIRVKFFESNSVIDEIRKHFEEGMERIAYKLLEETYTHMDDNIIFKKTGEEGRRQAHKEMFKEALKKYTIKIDVGSSSFDSIDDRREDAIAQFNIGMQAMNAGVQVDMTELFKDVIGTFEKKSPERFIKQQMPQVPGMPGMEQLGGGGQPLPNPEPQGPAQLTEQVALGQNLLANQQ